jgi:hypothetical protein
MRTFTINVDESGLKGSIVVKYAGFDEKWDFLENHGDGLDGADKFKKLRAMIKLAESKIVSIDVTLETGEKISTVEGLKEVPELHKFLMEAATKSFQGNVGNV